jgi:hypothetical protein
MRKSIIAAAALSALTWSTIAWAVLDTSVTITNEGQPVPGATISVSTSEGPPPKPVKKSDTSGRVPVRYDEKRVKRTTRVHLTVRARVPRREGGTQEVTREVDVSMDALISGQLVIDLVSDAPPGTPPVTNVPGGDWPGTYIGGGAGGRWTQCPDFSTVALSTGGPVSSGWSAPLGPDSLR